MPNIPTIVSNSSNQAGGLERSFSSTRATTQDFGGDVGSALEGVGNQLNSSLTQIDAVQRTEEEKKRNERVVLEDAKRPLTPILHEEMRVAPADGQGVWKNTIEKGEAQINKDAQDIFGQDPKAAEAYRIRKLGELKSVGNAAVTFEKTQGDNFSRDATNTALNTVYNGLRLDPTSYDTAVKKGEDVINASTAVDNSTKLSFISQFRQQAANTRFEGILGAAKTVEDLDAVGAQLKDPKWQAALSPKDYEAIGKVVTSQKITFQKKFDSDASSAISSQLEYSNDAKNPPLAPQALQDLKTKLDAAGQYVSVNNITQFSKLVASERVKAETRGLPPAEIYKLADSVRGGRAYPDMPPVVSDAINKASQLFPNVSPALLGATVTREYGANLKSGNYGVKAETSSATGVMQFTDKTWDDTAASATGRMALKSAGFDTSTMTPAQVRELRTNPVAAVVAGAALASQNKNTLEDNLKRPVTDAEVYMAHFLGAGGATMLLKSYATGGENSAAAMMPEAAAANRNVFYDKDGTPKTVRQVYNNISASIEGQPSQGVAYYGQRLQAAADSAKKALAANPVGYAQAQGTSSVVPLESPESWRARGTVFNQNGQHYDLANDINKPFNSDTEVQQLSQKMKDGTSEEVLSMLRNMADMDKAGPGSLASGLDQLGQKNSSYGIAASLVAGSDPDAATAGAVVRGQKRIDADGAVKEYATSKDVTSAFDKVAGASLFGVPPSTRAAIREAAIAHYIETTGTTNPTSFDKDAFAKSMNAVLGGGKAERIGSVNGSQTLLPKGVKEDEFNAAVDNVTADDLVTTSVDAKGRQVGSPPMYLTGEVVSPVAIASQGQLQYVGNDTYQVRMADNKALVRAEKDATTGFPLPYLMRMDKKTVDNIRNRQVAGSGIAPDMSGGGL